MNQELIKSQLYQWMTDFVEKPNPLLNNWAPCPFARQARISKSIEVIFSDIDNLIFDVEKNLLALETKEVLIVCFDHENIKADHLESLIKTHNAALMPRDYVILEDHPQGAELINGVTMNFGKCGLLLVQRLNKLTLAAKQLKEKGYYDTWSEGNLADVVTWRHG
jgi:hypothetical protein